MRRSEETLCPRPSLGAFFPAVLGGIGGLVAAEELSWRSYAGLPLAQGWEPLCGVALLACALLVAIALIRSEALRCIAPAFTLFAVAAACALACGLLSWQGWEADIDCAEHELSNSEAVTVEVLGDFVIREYGTLSPVEVQAGGHSFPARLSWPRDSEPLSSGHLLRVKGRLLRPAADEGGRWNHQNGYCGCIAADAVVDLGYVQGPRGIVSSFREDAFKRIVAYEGEGPCLLAGIVLGNRTAYAGSELEQDFKTCGLAHLMAVSGTHLAVVAALLGWLASLLSLGRWSKTAVVACCLLAYVALTGFAPSAMRACVMCFVGMFGLGIGRRRHLPTALLFCVLAFMLFRPTLVFSMGFQLSALAVAGLALLAPLAQAWLDALLPRKLRFASSSLAATLAATVPTLPVTMTAFSQLPLLSPVATLVVAPFITAGLGLGIVACVASVFFGPAATLALQGAVAICSACASLVHVLADLPLACVPLSSSGWIPALLFSLVVLALWLAWPLPTSGSSSQQSARGGLLPVAMALVVFCTPLAVALADGGGYLRLPGLPVYGESAASSRVVMLDVGQGDSTLVCDGSAAVLIDTGKDGALLERALARQGVTHLDAVFITHTDADHCGALSALTGVVSVDHVYLHADLLGQEGSAGVEKAATWVTKGRGAEGVGLGSSARVGHFSLTVISPAQGGEGGNEDSLVQVLEYDADGDGGAEARGLFTGDAETCVTGRLAGQVGQVDVLKVAHHGSRAGSGADELAVLRPKIALIGVGADNDYGHPTQDTLARLAAVRAKVYRTDLNGDIAVGFSPDHLSVDVQKREM